MLRLTKGCSKTVQKNHGLNGHMKKSKKNIFNFKITDNIVI